MYYQALGPRVNAFKIIVKYTYFYLSQSKTVALIYFMHLNIDQLYTMDANDFISCSIKVLKFVFFTYILYMTVTGY